MRGKEGGCRVRREMGEGRRRRTKKMRGVRRKREREERNRG